MKKKLNFKSQHSRQLNVITIIYISFIIGVITLLTCWAFLSYFPKSTTVKNNIIHIPKASSVHQISNILKTKNLIHSSQYFKLMTKIKNKDHLFKAGYFKLPKKVSQAILIELLTSTSGHHLLKKVTIPEGFSIIQIATKLEEKDICDAEKFATFAHTKAKDHFKEKFMFLSNIPLPTIEGYLFPETYFFQPNESITVIINSMLTEFKKNIYIPYTDLPKPLKYNFHELVTLASMIEKESRVRNEMPTISSVFYNRLNKKMRLASDPTIVYALGKSYKDKVYYKDLKIKSPYNTYRVGGFPPTPIASSGKKAFQAACFPAKTPYLFFVAKKDGTHYFSKTYQEHLAFQRNKK